MKKRSILIILACSMLAFSNCKKKQDDPAPAPAPIKIQTPGTGTALPPPGSTKSGSVTVDNYTQEFDVLESSGKDIYSLTGSMTNKTYNGLSAAFLSGKPTTNRTVDLSSDQTDLFISLSTTKMNYTATAGTATVSVADSKVTVSFTNVTFTPSDASASITASGSIASK